jgi:diguanylate cyclase (GGDEF)-like protein
MKFWLKQFAQYPPDHPDYWRVQLIGYTLLITMSYFFILALINLLYFNSLEYTLLDSVGLCISFVIFYHFRKTGHVKIASWATTIMVSSLIMLFAISAKGQSYSLFWSTLVPLISFFLIGRKWGTLISCLTFAVCAFLVYQQTQDPEPVTIRTQALFNIIEVCIAQVLLIRFYEKTRFSGYQKLALRNLEIQKMAETDKLTGLYNRDKLDKVLEQLLTIKAVNNDVMPDSGSRDNKSPSIDIGDVDDKKTTEPRLLKLISRFQSPISVVMIDIDHFKRINDNHGHLVGDKVLCELAHLLQSQMRNDDLLVRWGGEEFVMVLLNTTLNDTIELTERLRQYVAKQNIQGMALTISLGVAQYNSQDSADSILERADKALYKAKSQGRNCVAVA